VTPRREGVRPASFVPLPALSLSILLLALLPVPAHGSGPCPGADAPGLPFPRPLASPLEPRSRLAPVRIHRGERERWVGLVELGERVAFWIRRPCPTPVDSSLPAGAAPGTPAPSPADTGDRSPARGTPAEDGGLALAASVAGGAFSRFDLEENGNEFIEAHFRVGLRLLARLHGVEARAELYHVSSHLGDEFLQRTGREPISTSREGVEVLLRLRPAPGLRVYGGPGAVVRSTEDLEAASLRAGAEWRGQGIRWGPFSPYVSAEAYAWDELSWDPIISSEAGVSFGDGTFHLALTAGTGPSRAEQFFREEDETLWGVSFSITR